MLVRKMTLDDVESVIIIEKETFTEPWTDTDFKQALGKQNNIYLVVELGEQVIGYCGFWGVGDEGYIYNVAVKKEFRRKQIGYRMLKELVSKGIDVGISRFTLEVRSSNHGAIELYQRLGFERAGVRKEFYTKPTEDAVIMWLEVIQ